MVWIPYAVVGVFFSVAGSLVLWGLRQYGESINDTDYSFWLSFAVVLPSLTLLLFGVMQSRAFTQSVDHFKSDQEKLVPSTQFRIHVHPLVEIFVIWMLFGLPTIFVIDHLPKDSELKIELIILAYGVAPAAALLATRSKGYKEAVAKYEKYQRTQAQEKARQEHERQQAEQEAALDAKVRDLKRTQPMPPPSEPLSPEARKVADDIKTLWTK